MKMRSTHQNKSVGLSLVLCALLISVSILAQTGGARANSLGGSEIPITRRMELSVGIATVIKFDKAPKRISVSNPGILYLLPLSPTEYEFIGRNPGRTTVFIWTNDNKVIGSEISVGLPPPSYLSNSPTMEMIGGNTSELIYIGHPSEHIQNSKSGRMSDLITDMPEPCLLPGCI